MFKNYQIKICCFETCASIKSAFLITQLETADHHFPKSWVLQHVMAAMLRTIHNSHIINKIGITKSRMSLNETLF